MAMAASFSLVMFQAFVLLVALSLTSGSSGCGGPTTLTNLTGELSSPNYPQQYESDLDCRWRIGVPEGYRIFLTFKSPFELEEISNRCFDKLEITDGLSTHILCGRPRSKRIVSKGNRFDIRFTSDSSVQRRGFSILYFSLEINATTLFWLNPPAQSGCGGPRDLFAKFGVIVSHRRLGSVAYSNNLNCEWRILGRPNRNIRLRFDSFSTEDSHDCIYDHLDIYDGLNLNGTLIKKLCGHEGPADIVSSGPSLVLRFVSDRNIPHPGFHIFYSVIDRTSACAQNEFSCANGECTNNTNRCNEIVDCGDGSDEVGCSKGDCGTPAIPHYVGNGKIVAGRDVRPGSWPWMVQLHYGRRFYCGGSLITDRWIVTAAHCIDSRIKPDNWKIAIRSHIRREADDGEVRADVDLVIQHEDYNSNEIDYDIALIRLAQPVVLNDRISTVCLPKQSVPANTMCYAMGWGYTYGLEVTSRNDTLKQSYLPVISNEKCNQGSFYYGQITENMLCTEYDEGGPNHTCQRFSGGPLVCKGAHGKWEIQGVMSWGAGCAGRHKPGVNARVTRYTTWIKDKLSGNP